ncbi:MAG TPA: hypothetical protein VH498_04895 [Candidatus Dormibacteraeota bacterium]|jgi:hypothetical protein|nr:hypothetical protein [Candidatus Dormibacteraeota bacterium]
MRAPRIFRRVFDRTGSDELAGVGINRLPAADRPHLVDSHTRTFWSHGGGNAAATLVEAERGEPAAPTGRASTLVADHERGVASSGRPRANPAFSEAVFVELMRARQYRRAYGLLSPECQQSWGALEAFVAAQRIGALATLRGVKVNEVRHLEGWRDPDSGMVHAHAAELDVVYEIGDASRTVSLPRTVHLVAHRGAWRSLCYPTATRQP